jgi:hypothetical protein
LASGRETHVWRWMARGRLVVARDFVRAGRKGNGRPAVARPAARRLELLVEQR